MRPHRQFSGMDNKNGVGCFPVDPSLAIRMKAQGIKLPFPVQIGRYERPPKAASDTLAGILKRFDLEDSVWHQRIVEDWPVIAGPQIAKHTWPGSVSNKTLLVHVRHSLWLSELQRFGQKELLKKIQDRFGKDKIRSLRFALDPEGR